jgi:dihydroorotase
MLTTMNKVLNMGVPLEEVIRMSTVNPAQEIGHPELGHLTVGADADIAVLQRSEGEFSFIDCGKAKLKGNQKLDCVMTVRAGEIVYDPSGLSMPEWKDAPAAYWRINH